MEIAFGSKEIRSLCECNSTAELSLGVEIAKILKIRISDVLAAYNYNDLLLGNPRISNNELILDLNKVSFLIFIPNHPVTLKEMSLEWVLVSRLKLIKIGSYT